MNRHSHIDFLRAVSILGVLAVHTYYFHLTTEVNRFIWNYLQFVVFAFIVCSGYIFFASSTQATFTLKSILPWYKERISRLLIPYYIYLCIHYLLVVLLPTIFTGIGMNTSLEGFIKAVLLIGGVDVSWVPLLFIQLSLLLPLLLFLSNKKPLFYLFGLFLFAIMVFFSLERFPYAYQKLVMWIPWSSALLFSLFLFSLESKSQKTKSYLLVTICSAAIFFLLFYLWNVLEKPLLFIDNKYPPNLYHIVYALFGTTTFLLLSQLSLFEKPKVKNIYEFISKHAYALFLYITLF